MALKQGHSAEQTAELAIDDLGLDLGRSTQSISRAWVLRRMLRRWLPAWTSAHARSWKKRSAALRAKSTIRQQLLPGGWMTATCMLCWATTRTARTHGEFDPSSTARLAALSKHDVDFDLGDVDADGVGEADADGMHHHAHGSNGSGLDLDVGTATVPDTAFTATQKLASDDLALPDLEPVTMSEVGTKLDLARAYMDMGDPEGARNILEEVLTEGSVAQKQEAQRLMESLPGLSATPDGSALHAIRLASVRAAHE